MHYINLFFLQITNPPSPTVDFCFPEWLEYVKSFAPIFGALAAIANLLLAYTVFKFVKAKHNKDRNIKWFQELVYSSHKEIINKYFEQLHELRQAIPENKDLAENDKIEVINVVKNLSEDFLISFVVPLNYIAPAIHTQISKLVDELTDDLTMVFDNDELKLFRPLVYRREITTRIATTKGKILKAIFNYQG